MSGLSQTVLSDKVSARFFLSKSFLRMNGVYLVVSLSIRLLSVLPIPFSNSCTVWLCTAAYLGLLSIAIGNCKSMSNHCPILSESICLVIVLLRLWVLWERNRRLMGWTILYYVLTQIAAIACSTITLGRMIGQYSPLPVHMSQV